MLTTEGSRQDTTQKAEVDRSQHASGQPDLHRELSGKLGLHSDVV